MSKWLMYHFESDRQQIRGKKQIVTEFIDVNETERV